MSQGLLNPQILELASASKCSVQEIVVAPSYLMKDAWEFDQYKELFGIAMSNLLENADPCIKDSTSTFNKIMEEKKVNK